MFGEFAKQGPMSTEAIPHIKTIEVEWLCDAVLAAATAI
jgi:hypothetical protein